MLLVASRKGLFRFRERGEDWEAGPPAFLGEPVTAVLRDPRDGAIYAALRLGHFGVKLHRSDDAGETWTQLQPPAFPTAEEQDGEKAASVDMIFRLVPGGADEPGVLWAGTLPAALFRSSDRGASWSLVEGLWNVPERKEWFGGGFDISALHSIHVHPDDSRRLTVAISCGGVWKSDDGGGTWRNVGHGLRAEYMPPGRELDVAIQDPHLLGWCRAMPDRVWCQHHNGVFVSDDGAETFRKVEAIRPTGYGFPALAHPHDPRTAWFVSAGKDESRVPLDGRLVVSRTRDGGDSFEMLGTGLPQRGSYDLIYRHALNVDAGGERLAMGSTTGNLWTSDDAGESWTLVSGTLPPIAAVAFA